MSTNDTVVLMASGASGITPDPADFAAALTSVCHDLARQLLADAEGATKEITVEVAGAVSEDDAVEVGRAIARNNLLKCALFGNDPNWGRVLAAIGTTSATERIVWASPQGRRGVCLTEPPGGTGPRSTSPDVTCTSASSLR